MIFLAFVLLGACGTAADAPARCERCGMLIVADSDWTTDAPDQQYDTPKCALWATDGNSTERASLQFHAYYSSESLAGESLVFVVGSDVIGPMGDDTVPVRPANAAHFVEDHGGRQVTFADLNAAVLAELDP